MDVSTDSTLASLDPFFHASALPAMLIDLGRRQIIRVNTAALDLLGLPEHDVLGRAGRDFFTEVPDEQIPRARALRGERTSALREIRTATGPRIVELYLVPTGIGEIALAQAVDLTDALDSAAAAQHRIEELQRASEQLTTIGSRLAHDLRSPLTVIAGFASVLRDNADDLSDEQIHTMLGRIETSAHSLGTLTDAILEDARVRADDVAAMSFDSADLVELVRGATAAQLGEAGGELVETGRVERLPVPVGTLLQPVLNLVSNAVKYRDPDRAVRVEVAISECDAAVRIEVRDDGSGLGDDPDLLFAAGARGANSNGTVGSGLGLSFVRAAMEALGGDVAAENRAGGGAIVRLTIPRPTDDGSSTAGGNRLGGAQLGRILDASPVPTVVIDLERRRIVRVNEAVVRLIGAPADAIVGRPGRDFLDDESIGDALRDAAMAVPGTFSSSAARIRTARGLVPTRVSLATVPESVLAVAQLVPEPCERDGVADASGTSSLTDVIAVMATTAVARAEEIGAEGLRATLERIERLARAAG